MSRDSSVGTVIDYRLYDQVIGVRLPEEAGSFSLHQCPERLWGPPTLLSNGTGGSFPGG
jgi:hypothetical protein